MPEALATALEVVDDPDTDTDAELEPDDELELELPQAAINTELAAATATRRRLRETLGFKAGSPELSMGQVRAQKSARATGEARNVSLQVCGHPNAHIL